MVYEERNTWVQLVVTLAALGFYVVSVLQQAGGGPLADVDWVPLMLWAIGGGIGVSILVSILWGILAGVRDRAGAAASDERDRDIARMGDRVGRAFSVIGGLGAILLCAVAAPVFWIANAVFFGFALDALVGGAARAIAYRRGLV